MTKTAKQKRNNNIIKAFNKGSDIDSMAKKYNLTINQIKNIICCDSIPNKISITKQQLTDLRETSSSDMSIANQLGITRQELVQLFKRYRISYTKIKITKKRLLALQKRFKTDQAIGNQFNITRQAIYQYRKKYNISKTTTKSKKWVDVTELLDCCEEALTNFIALDMQGFKLNPKNEILHRLANNIRKFKGETELTKNL